MRVAHAQRSIHRIAVELELVGEPQPTLIRTAKVLAWGMTISKPRRAALTSLGAIMALGVGGRLFAQPSEPKFAQWVEGFRARARDRGVSEATYRRVMGSITPDTSVYALD